MRQISSDEQAQLLAVLEKYWSRLMSFVGVHHVDVGFRVQGEQLTDELSIRVHLTQKRPIVALFQSSILPTLLDGIGVDVIESAKLQQNIQRNIRFDPVVGGIQTGNVRLAAAGTLGLVVRRNGTDELLGLSNHHVWVRTVGQVGDSIDQPHSMGQSDVIGSLLDWNKRLDCAVSLLNHARQYHVQQALELPLAVTGIAAPLVGMPVVKSGLTSRTTYGLVDGVGLPGTDLSIVPDPVHPLPLSELSMGGDSGSVWIHAQTGAAIGLHHSGEQPGYAERAWASRMTDVAEAMNFHI